MTIEARNAGTFEEIIAASSPKNLPDNLTQQLIDNYYRKVKLAERTGIQFMQCDGICCNFVVR